MLKTHTVNAVQAAIQNAAGQNKKIGFVPTMGALHQGHLSLIDIAKENADVVVVSVFVNPTQFNDPKDFEKYPRTIDDDFRKLEESGVDIVFNPETSEIYPEEDIRNFDFGLLDKMMEGKHRPGHFEGVAQVVSRLFDIVKPQVVVFGEKDYQQLAVIKKLVNDYNYPIEIIPGPTLREANGLAMSSRNERLTADERANAAVIRAVLLESQSIAGNYTPAQVEEWVIKKVNHNPHLTVEYFQISDNETLRPVTGWQENCDYVGCIAVFCGDVRLIDNIKYSL
ncbi:MAG: pantoate--beta-alanine ligase [Salinivirgaceae bacterium]|jgi:pantoate--beta-alanine ligase|nr:pantoate--beta-alanine ligase [Salinivirgaceae bacterium]